MREDFHRRDAEIAEFGKGFPLQREENPESENDSTNRSRCAPWLSGYFSDLSSAFSAPLRRIDYAVWVRTKVR